MTTNPDEIQTVKQSSNLLSLVTGFVFGSLVGAGTILLMAPQTGEKTRAEIQQGVEQLRDRTTETVKDTVTQVKSKANQIKADVQIKAEELQHQGKTLLVKQLDRVSQMADAGKKAIENSAEHTVV